MADSFNKKDREKKRQKRKKEKEERKKQRKEDGVKPLEFMYVDENGNLTASPPDLSKKTEIDVEDIDVSTPKGGNKSTNSFERKGFVKFFNQEKGYGFIVDSDSDESYFVHIDNVQGQLADKDRVSFEIGKGHKGPVAINVKVAE